MEHKYAAVLRAIADGKEIQYRNCGAATWFDTNAEGFLECMYKGRYEWRAKPERISAWLNVYGHMCSDLYDTKEAADAGSMGGRIACIPVEFNEGDGL